MLPLVLGAAAITALVGWWLTSDDLQGKKVLLVGPSGSGKSTLHDYLMNGEVSLLPGEQTLGDPPKEQRRKLSDVGLVVTSVDYPGDPASFIEALRSAHDIDLLVFVASAVELRTSSYAEHCCDLAATATNVRDRVAKMLVLSHADEALGGAGPYSLEDLDTQGSHDKLAKFLDESSPVLGNLLAADSRDAAFRELVARLR